MKKITLLIMFIATAAIWLYSCKPKPVEKFCDNSINNWDHFITKSQAQSYIDALKARKSFHPGIHATDSSIVAVAQKFGRARDMMRNMMLRDSCVGIRVYYGLKNESIIPIICGIDSTGNDIYWVKPPAGNAKTTGTNEGLMDNSDPEPPKMASRSMH